MQTATETILFNWLLSRRRKKLLSFTENEIGLLCNTNGNESSIYINTWLELSTYHQTHWMKVQGKGQREKQTKGNQAAQRKERKEILIFDSKITKSSKEETNKKCDERLY